MLTPQSMTDPAGCAEAVIEAAKESTKPILSCWMGAKLVAEGRQRFAEAGIPQFNSPENAVEAFGYLACYRRNQKALLQAPGPLSPQNEPDVEGAKPHHRTRHQPTAPYAQHRRSQGGAASLPYPRITEHQRDLCRGRTGGSGGAGAAGGHEDQFAGYHAQVGCRRCSSQHS